MAIDIIYTILNCFFTKIRSSVVEIQPQNLKIGIETVIMLFSSEKVVGLFLPVCLRLHTH